MSWDSIKPVRRVRTRQLRGTQIALGQKNGVRRVVSIRVERLPPGWVKGRGIVAADGSGDNAGYLRLALARSGEMALGYLHAHGNRGQRRVLTVNLPLPAGARGGSLLGPVDVDCEADGDALILGPLPDWACPSVSRDGTPPAPTSPAASTPRPRRAGSDLASPGPGAGDGAPLRPADNGHTGPMRQPIAPSAAKPKPAGRPGFIDVTDKIIPRR